jgi:hypothetical protein
MVLVSCLKLFLFMNSSVLNISHFVFLLKFNSLTSTQKRVTKMQILILNIKKLVQVEKKRQ